MNTDVLLCFACLLLAGQAITSALRIKQLDAATTDWLMQLDQRVQDLEREAKQP